MGFSVTVKDDDVVQTGDGQGKKLVLLSETCLSALLSAKFRDVTVPVFVSEPAVTDEMKLTGGKWGTDQGDAQGQTRLSVLSGTPFSAGLSGQINVTGEPRKFVFGRPSASAVVGAFLIGPTTAVAIYGYETGAPMADGFAAPARRVGFFAGDRTPEAMLPDGRALFEAAVRWLTRPQALLVVGSTPLVPGDAAVKARLEGLGFAVPVKRSADTTPSDGEGNALIVVSESSNSADINSDYRHTSTPVVTLEPAINDELGTTGPAWSVDYGVDVLPEAANVLITSPSHPLAAGLREVVRATTTAATINWGRPNASAVRAAVLASDPSKATVFGYAAGSPLFGLTAPAARVSFFAHQATPLALSDEGWALFDASVRFAAGTGTTFETCWGRLDGTPCSDGNACNGEEYCQAGVCATGTPVVCDDDNNPCTADACEPTAGCVFRPVPAGSSCSDGNACNGEESCNATALCLPGDPLLCNDGNDCTYDQCDPMIGCVAPPAMDGQVCASTDGCGTGFCEQGSCEIEPDGGNPICQIAPQLACTIATPSGYRAIVGYTNATNPPRNVHLPAGLSNNAFSPGAPSRGQPSWFEAGGAPAAFVVDLPAGASVTWRLGNQSLALTGAPGICAGTYDAHGVEGPTFTSGGTTILPEPDPGKIATGKVQNRREIGLGPLPGDGDVTGDGAFNYGVPIWVPPGRNGMQPSLSLSYSSNGRNGLLGVGWSLGGLSSVGRCPSTRRTRGLDRPVLFDTGDQFCLDGNPLVKVDGTSGFDGEYRTLTETFAKVVASGTSSGPMGPERWTVYTKDGRIAIFKRPPQQHQRWIGPTQLQPVVYSWPVTEVRDRHNNVMRFQYTYDVVSEAGKPPGFSERPNAISYTGPEFRRSVAFVYEDRPAHDAIESYVAGLRFVTVKKLARIRLFAPNPVTSQLVKEYRLGYLQNASGGPDYVPGQTGSYETTSSVTGRLLLESVSECENSNAEADCRPPTRFTWEKGEWGFDEHVLGPAPSFGFTLHDLNNDGLDDIVYREGADIRNRPTSPRASLNVTFREKSSTGYLTAGGIAFKRRTNTTTRPSGAAANPSLSAPEPLVDFVIDSAEAFTNVGGGQFIRYAISPIELAPDPVIADLDLDGIPEAIIQEPLLTGYSDGTPPGSLSIDRFVTAWRLGAQAGDPGTTDASFVRYMGSWQTAPIAAPLGVIAADIDGDGFPDLIKTQSNVSGKDEVPRSASWAVAQPRGRLGGGFSYSIIDEASLMTEAIAIDIDGNGVTDFFKVEDVIPEYAFADSSPVWFDFNGDSLIDGLLGEDIRPNFGDRRFPIEQKVGRSESAFISDLRFQDNGVRPVDFDMDGRTDLLLFAVNSQTKSDPQKGGDPTVLLSKANGFRAIRLRELGIGQSRFLSEGSFISDADDSFTFPGFRNSQVTDYDGDGLVDVLHAERRNGQNVLVLYLRRGEKPDVITEVHNGVTFAAGGAQAPPSMKVTYQHMGDPGSTAYDGRTCANQVTAGVGGTECVRRGMRLVSKLETDAGLPDGGTTRRAFEYKYINGRRELESGAFLGFERHILEDAQRDTTVTTDYYMGMSGTPNGQEPSLVGNTTFQRWGLVMAGRPRKQVTEVRRPGGSPNFTTVESSYEFVEYNGARTSYVRPTKVEETFDDGRGPCAGERLTTTEMTYGTPETNVSGDILTRKTVRKTSPTCVSRQNHVWHETRETFVYFNEPATWIIGRLTSEVAEQELPFELDDLPQPDLRRTTRIFTIDPATGHVTDQIVEPLSPDEYRRTHYDYTLFGLPATVTESAHPSLGLQARVTTTEYDAGEAMFPFRVTNGLGHVTESVWYPSFGGGLGA
jgi:hypothetical protein